MSLKEELHELLHAASLKINGADHLAVSERNRLLDAFATASSAVVSADEPDQNVEEPASEPAPVPVQVIESSEPTPAPEQAVPAEPTPSVPDQSVEAPQRVE